MAPLSLSSNLSARDLSPQQVPTDTKSVILSALGGFAVILLILAIGLAVLNCLRSRTPRPAPLRTWDNPNIKPLEVAPTLDTESEKRLRFADAPTGPGGEDMPRMTRLQPNRAPPFPVTRAPDAVDLSYYTENPPIRPGRV